MSEDQHIRLRKYTPGPRCSELRIPLSFHARLILTRPGGASFPRRQATTLVSKGTDNLSMTHPHIDTHSDNIGPSIVRLTF